MKTAFILLLLAILSCKAPAPDAEVQSRLEEEIAYAALKQENRKKGLFTHLLKFKSLYDLPTLNVQQMQGIKQPFIYLGKESSLYSFESRVELEPPYQYRYPEMHPRHPDSTLLAQLGERRLIVHVDTNAVISLKYQPAYSIAYNQAPQNLNEEETEAWIRERTREVQAYPVYIWNAGDDAVAIGAQDSGSSYVVLQAKDEKGQWQTVEHYLHSFCGNSYWTLLLRPDYYLVTGVYRYEGDFKTEMRVMADTVYSNTFYGSINKSQFPGSLRK